MEQVVDATWGAVLVYGLVGLFALLESAGAVGLIVPGTIVLLLGGVAGVAGFCDVMVVFAVGAVGAIGGDCVGYVLGRSRRTGERGGRISRGVGVDRWRGAEELVAARGASAAVFARRTRLLRALVPTVAGGHGVPRFLRWSVLGSLLWSVTVIGIGCVVGVAGRAVWWWFGDAAVLVAGVLVWAVLIVWVARVSVRHRALAREVLARVAATSAVRRLHGRVDSLVRRSGVGPVAATILALGTMVVAACTALLAKVFDDLLEGDGVVLLDHPTLDWLAAHRDPAFTVAMIVITDVGSTFVMACAATGVTAWCAWKRRWWAAATVATTALGAGLLVKVGKAAVGRARPPRAGQLVVETNQSFPSGHALVSVAVLGVLAAVAVYSQRRWAPRVWTTAGVVFAVGLIGFTRLYLGVHWPTDILAGWLIATSWLTLCLLAAATLRYRRKGLRTADPVPDDHHSSGSVS